MKTQEYGTILCRIKNRARKNMSQKLLYNIVKPQEHTVDQAAVTPSPMDLVWDLFSTLSSSWNDRPPSFESGRFHVLPFHVESSVANAHIQEEFLPRFDFAERHIEQLSPTDSLSEALHMLHVLSLMERGIEKWNQRHQFEVISTPRAVHVLYSKLFQKAEPPKKLLPAAPAKWSFTLLGNPSKTNCFFNVAIQTLFSSVELAANIVFSPHQFPEVKFAFLQYQEAAAMGAKDPLDLATTLRMLYPCFKEEGHHDASEALLKMIEPVERDRAPFCSLTRATTYAGYEPNKKVLEGFLPGGTRIEETQEAVYTLEVPDQGCLTLEDALFHSFNEVVTDPTPVEFIPTDGSGPVLLPRVAVQTRYTSAPKFLIFNLSLGDINLQAMTPEKKISLVGLQQAFYLSGQLTVDGKGAKYRLLSFNAHQGEGATEGHYVHYRETPKGFFAISDDVSTKVSEIEYLLPAQTAYTVVLEREDQPISEEDLYQGYLDNQRRLSAMVLIFQALEALNGAVVEPARDQVAVFPYLTQFIQSVIEGEPSLDAFKELPLSLQNLLLDLWSTSGNAFQMSDELDEQIKHPFSIPKTYSEEVFSGNYDLVPLMVDRLAKRLHNHPEEVATLKSHYDLIILSLGQISRDRAIAQHRFIIRRARVVNALFREVGQLALTCGVTALKLSSWDKKTVTIETLRSEGAVTLQALSSLARFIFTGIDPLGQSPTLQLGQQLITPALAMAQHHHDRGTWSFIPLLTSALNMALSLAPISESKKALATNFAPLAFTDVLLPSYQSASTKTQLASLALSHLLHPNGREGVASRLSALYGFVSQLATHRLEQHTDPNHIQTSPQGWAARTLHILATNPALQSLVTETATRRLRPPKALPSLSPQERKAIRDKKYEELKQAIHDGDGKRAQFHADEITHLEHQLSAAGIDLKTDPLQLQDLIDAHEQYATQATRFNSLIDEQDQALAKEDHETAERLEQELESLFPELEVLREKLGLPSERPAQDALAPEEQQTEPPNHLLIEEIKQTTEELKRLEEAIAIGTQHVQNLQNSGEFADDARYKVKKKSGDWRVYRNGMEVFHSYGGRSKDKRECNGMIPSLKKKYGTPIPTQESTEATQALHLATEKQSRLLEKLGSLKQQLPPEPKVEMRDEGRYKELVAQEIKIGEDLATAYEKRRKADKQYEIAKKVKEDHKSTSNLFKYIGYKSNIPRNYLKDHKEKKQAYEEAKKKVARLEESHKANKVAQAEASAPKQAPPSLTIPNIVNKKTKKHHHLSYTDSNGQKQSLGKYSTKEDADFISGQFSKLLAEGKSLELTCYDAMQKALSQGVPIEELPIRPYFEMPTMKGNNASKNSDLISKAFRGFKTKSETFLSTVSGVVEQHGLQPIQAQGLAKSEIKKLSQALQPKIKDPKQHGISYKTSRALGRGLNKTERFLTRIGFSGEVSTPSVPLYTTTPPKSTPSYVPDYGPNLPTQPTSRPITTPAPVAEPHTAPTFQNPFIPLAPNTLPPVSMPALPQPSTSVISAPPPKPTFGERFQGVIRNLFDQGFPNSTPLKPRTQVMIFPQEPSTPQNPLPQFTPDLQTRYPEAYALARNIDQFGREQVALFRVTLDNHQRRPHFFREFDALPTLLERTTGQSLHTPSLTPERSTPLSLRVETLAIATLQNPRVQGTIQAAGGLGEAGLGAYMTIQSYGLAAPAGWALMVHGLDHAFTGMQTVFRGTPTDTVTVQALQRMGLSHNNAELVDTGLSLAGGIGGERALTMAPRMVMTRRLLSIEEVAAKQLAAQRAFLERVNSPAFRSGFVSDKALAKLGEKDIKLIKQIERFVGKNPKVFYNKAGDIVVESKDGLRQFRIDLLQTKPHKNPHSHLIRYTPIKNKKIKDWDKRIYPRDVKPE